MNPIKNSKISHKLLALAGLPLILFTVLGVQEVISSRTQVEQSLRTEEAMEAFSLLDGVAHNFAVERGLTAGFLGSKGDAGIKDKLNNQRLKADNAQNALQRFSPEYIDTALWNKAVNEVNSLFTDKTNVRAQVDTLKPNVSPFAYYSNLNRHAIAAASLVSSQSSSPEVSQQLSALLSLITMKEKAGQSRGAMNGIWARKSTTLDNYAQVNNYINDFNFAAFSVSSSLVGNRLKQFNGLSKDAVWGEIDKIEKQFLNQKDNLSALEGPTPQEWFPLATKRIGALNGFKNEIISSLRDQLKADAAAASQHSLIIMIGLAVVITLVVLLSFSTITSINKRVRTLASTLSTMANNKDVSRKLFDGSKDEIGEIERSVDHFVENLLGVLTSAAQLSVNAEKTLEQLMRLTREDVESAKQTSSRCETLAAAMTQMSQSSDEVARYAQDVEGATNSAREVTHQAIGSGEQSAKQTTDLISSIDTTFGMMQELQKQTANVKEILDNITGISEQTNLLALNAAIEAARAGEMGRGFAVVADEVRNLAQRSKQSTEEISSMLEDIRRNTENSFSNMQHSRDVSYSTQQAVDTSKESLEQLGYNIDDMATKNADISEAARQQAQTVSSVSQEIEALVEISRASSEGSQTIELELAELRDRIKVLADNIGYFKIA